MSQANIDLSKAPLEKSVNIKQKSITNKVKSSFASSIKFINLDSYGLN